MPGATVIHPWRKMKGIHFLNNYKASCFYYWKKHPEKRPKNLFKHYGYYAIRSFLKVTIPNIIKFKARGLILILERDFWLFKQAITNIND